MCFLGPAVLGTFPLTATPIFTKFGWYDVGPILRPYLEDGYDWSMWAWLIIIIPNRHTFSFCISGALPITANITAQT